MIQIGQVEVIQMKLLLSSSHLNGSHMDLDTAKNLAVMATPLTTLVVNTFLKPKFELLAESLGKKQRVIGHDILNKFESYLDRAYASQSYVRTVVFQNNKKLLNDLYIPLTISNTTTSESVKIDSYPKKLLPSYEKVLLVDTAGMGKSTISRFLFLKIIEGNHGVPVFIELRRLRTGVTILELIQNDIDSINEAFDKNLLLNLINRGDFIFVFDGFDEIPIKDREFATQHLQDFIAKVPNNKFLITSRQDSALNAFADFQRFIIKPLRQQEAYDLLKKYDFNGEVSAALITKLEENNRDTLKSFLTNPLLVSLLFKAYDFKPTLPLRADVFYRQVYEALFENHDLSKGGSFIRQKSSGLNIDDFARVLRALAIKTVISGSVQYTSDELIAYVKESKERCAGLSFSESDFIKDLIQNVPLFVQDGLEYRWNHKSFQEYFAALFISVDAKGSADKMLQKLVDNKEQLRFMNLFELYYDIDPDTFQKALTKRLIEDFVNYMSGNSYEIKYPYVDKNDVALRKLICFGRRYVLFNTASISKIANEEIGNDSVKVHQVIRGYCLDHNLLRENEVIGSSTHYPSGSALVVMSSYNIIIMEVLGRKKHKTILDMRQLIYKSRLGFNTILSPNSVAGGLLPVLLTEEINNYLNSKDNFQKVTQLLIENDRVRISMDLDECNKELLKINQSISKNNLDDLLFGI
ncbi:NACHT domain-containing protein [Hymenobacter guriensis]|uniref:NACHT domain-containing protein n=1 Tax=Hymenobacter guriensis TaxID=2793065 RepID=A0ABS0L4Y9_9BACT|nr:NACHT domain-containing protein [Hymenobacter guriensis]MBG8555196.1 NACHT domain-containing protein [Hymenobacter guriensis]